MTQNYENHILKARTSEIALLLREQAKRNMDRFPSYLDDRILSGLDRMIVNSPKDFLATRSLNHTRSLLLTQFFLQKKMEDLIKESGMNNPLILKLFKAPTRVCVALVFLDTYSFRREQLHKTIQTLMPGMAEIPRSFYLWHHPELPYLFCYVEIHKLRGKELSAKDLAYFERALQDHLHASPPLTPALFWPYNEEESFRQVQILHREIEDQNDIPHVSIHFREQTPVSIEFLIHLARPKGAISLTKALKDLPESLECFCYFQRVSKNPFPIELGAFAIKVPAHFFDVRDSINLLYARRYIMKYLISTLGPCRDYNGGLFEKQQQFFEKLRLELSEKVPLFDLFAERVFYALHPVEKRLTLDLKEAEELFGAFSKLIRGKEQAISLSNPVNLTIIKASDSFDLVRPSYMNRENKQLAHTQLDFGGHYYLCVIGGTSDQLEKIVKKNAIQKKAKTLRLIFEEGAPTSLNPYHASGDMRCRLLCKLFFDGLTRLNKNKEVELAGAISYELSEDKKTYTFKLRPHSWSNGERVTANDYVSSLRKALRDLVSHPEIHYNIKNAKRYREKKVKGRDLGVRALDAETLQIELEQPDPRFLHMLAHPSFYPLFGAIPEPKWFNGPFLLREFDKDHLLIEKNPYYWNKNQVYFETIEIKWTMDIEKIGSLFSEGKIDWIGDPVSTLSFPIIQRLAEQGMLHQHEAKRRFLVIFNTHHPILSCPFIRKALSLSIDRSLICNTIYPHSLPMHPPLPLEEEAKVFFEKGLEALGLTQQTFPKLTFSYSHQTRREKLAQSLQADWKRILGIDVLLEKTEWNLFRNKLEKGQFEISGTIQDMIHDDSPVYFDRFEGLRSWNFSKWQNQAYRELVNKAKLTIDKQEAENLLFQAEEILMDESPFTPLFKYTHLYAHHPKLENYLMDQEGCVDFSTSYLNLTE